MKKLMIAAVMMLGASSAFAADSPALKAILGLKDYSQAAAQLQSSLSTLASSAEKAKAYNHLVKLAKVKYDAENAIQAANMQAQLTKKEEQAYDTVGFYNAAYAMLENGLECIKYDAEPNEKGKVSPKFTSSLKGELANARLQLVNGGQYFAQHEDDANLLKFWGTFLDTDDNPLFAEGKEQEKGYIGQVAYYAAAYASQAGKYEQANRYADIAMQDPNFKEQAQNLKFSAAQQNLKTREDSIAFANQVKTLYQNEPANQAAFGTLSNLYAGLNMNSELDALLADQIQRNPTNSIAYALKGQTLMNRNNQQDAANWDECIDAFKKAVELDATNPIVLTYLGFCINAKASQIEGDRAGQKALYTESMKYLEQAKELDPNRDRANWAYPLYQCYYLVYAASDPRTLEMEKLLQ